MVGISWGGKVAVGVEKYRPGLMDGVALLCPGFRPRVALSPGERWAVAWARLTAPKRTFPVPLSDPALFTASEKWQTFLRDDPLALHDATARLLFASAMLDFYLRDVGRRMRLPVLMLLAGRDRIIDNRRTREFVGRFAGPTEVVEYPEAHHTLEFEPDPDRHMKDLIEWLQRRARERRLIGGTGIFVRPGLTPMTRGWSPVRRTRNRVPCVGSGAAKGSELILEQLILLDQQYHHFGRPLDERLPECRFVLVRAAVDVLRQGDRAQQGHAELAVAQAWSGFSLK